MYRTRKVWLADQPARLNAANRATQFGTCKQEPPNSFLSRFLLHYNEIREIKERCPAPGLCVVAVDERKVAGAAGLAAKANTINTGVIGRHSMTDLFLQGDPTLSLRHLMVVLHPMNALDGVRYRLMDLRTHTAFRDESGRHLEGFEAEETTFVQCGRYTLYLFPTGGLPWPDNAHDCWSSFPERIYFQDETAEPDRWLRRRANEARPPSMQTLIRETSSPSFMQYIDDTARVQAVNIGAAGAATRIHLPGSCVPVTHETLSQGVLLGRCDRCDHHRTAALRADWISRVHLLIMSVGGRTYAVDTASTHGVWQHRQRIRQVALEQDMELKLGYEGVPIRWSPTSSDGSHAIH